MAFFRRGLRHRMDTEAELVLCAKSRFLLIVFFMFHYFGEYITWM